MEINIDRELFNILTEIAYGLKHKHDTVIYNNINEIQTKYKYPMDKYLIRAIDKLAAFGVKYKLYEKVHFPKNETDAIIFFSENLLDWIKSIESAISVDLSNLYYEDDFFVELFGNNLYKVTDFCSDFASYCLIYNKDLEQKQVYGLMKKLDQEQYVFVRMFIIENPIINFSQKNLFNKKAKDLKIDEETIIKLIETAYEEIPKNSNTSCGYCKWTVTTDLDGSKVCVDSRCKLETNSFMDVSSIEDARMSLRLTPGVMRFISLPGKLELDIAEMCKKLKLEYKLWPNKDAYDIKIELKNGRSLAIDAKDYKNPFMLATNFMSMESGISFGEDCEERYIVVPDSVNDKKVDYCDVVNSALQKNSKGIKCIKISELFEILIKEV
ncbi:MAG: hypothetical protein ACRC41_15780 [Sarcina sp.]